MAKYQAAGWLLIIPVQQDVTNLRKVMSDHQKLIY